MWITNPQFIHTCFHRCGLSVVRRSFVDGTAKNPYAVSSYVCLIAAHTVHDQFEEIFSDHQADLSAEQPSSFEDARLPPAYEHPRWPRNLGCTPSQGPRPPLRLSFREVLPRSNRMVNPADFRLAIRSGSRAGQQRLIVHCRTDEDSDSRLVGFVVPKSQIKRAVGRNRVKRQLRHLMKERLGALPQGARVVVRVKHDALGASSCELGEELDQVLRRAWKKWDHREGGRP